MATAINLSTQYNFIKMIISKPTKVASVAHISICKQGLLAYIAIAQFFTNSKTNTFCYIIEDCSMANQYYSNIKFLNRSGNNNVLIVLHNISIWATTINVSSIKVIQSRLYHAPSSLGLASIYRLYKLIIFPTTFIYFQEYLQVFLQIESENRLHSLLQIEQQIIQLSIADFLDCVGH